VLSCVSLILLHSTIRVMKVSMEAAMISKTSSWTSEVPSQWPFVPAPRLHRCERGAIREDESAMDVC
jgi:hypothetical protein